MSDRYFRRRPIENLSVAVFLIVANASGLASAESGDLFPTDCDVPGDAYCDDLPAEFQLISKQEKQSCFDPWLPRSCGHLPLMKQLVEGRDAKLPPPLGISYIVTALERNVSVTDIRIGANGGPQESLQRFSVDDFNTNGVTQIVRADAWILPFLNVYGLVGETRTKGDLVARIESFPFPNSPPLELPIRIALDGITYGGGATVK